MMGKYIYGIINSNKELFSDTCSVKNTAEGSTACETALFHRASKAALPYGTASAALKDCYAVLHRGSRTAEGSTGSCITEANEESKISNGVYAIPYQDISAAVSDSEIVNYAHLLKGAVARQLIRHQKIIEGIMSRHAIIPMRLGTFAQDEAEVRDILNKGYKLIKDIFAKISDKIEIDVAATWSDSISALKEIGEEKEIKEFKEKLLANPEGITVDDQMKVGLMVKKALDKKREKCAEEIQKALKTVSQDSRAHELMDDKMVVNSAFLINKARQKDFDRKVEELNTNFAEKLNFRCVGPLPPYSFYTLEMKKMQFEEIDWARKKLGLDDFASKDEIKKAHQRSAISTHPDKNPDIPGIEREFDEGTKAYKILVDYCLASEQGEQGANYSFNKNEVKKNAILVKVR